MYTCIFCRKQIKIFQQKYNGQFRKQRQRLGPVQSASQPQLSVAQARTRRGSQSQRRYFSPRTCWPLPPHQLAPCSSSSPPGLSQFPSESSWTPAGRSAPLFTSSAQLPSAQERQANGVRDKECSENIFEDELCSETKSSCQINWAGDPKALISTGCSGNQAPEHAIACGNLECAYYGIQDVRCFCSTEKCSLDTNYPIECDPQPTNGAKKQVAKFSLSFFNKPEH